MVVYVGIAPGRDDGAARSPMGRRLSAVATSRRRCSASPTRSTPIGWPTVFKYTIVDRGDRDADRRVELRDARPVAAGLLAVDATARSPARWGACTRRARRPFVLIIMAAVIAGALIVPEDLDFLVGIYAFGALLGLTIAHLSIISLRYREPDRERFYSVPLSVPFRGGSLPLPAVVGAIAVGRGVGQRRDHPLGRALRRLRLDGLRPRDLRRLPTHAGQVDPQARDGPRGGAASWSATSWSTGRSSCR